MADFIGYPRGKVVAVFDTPAAADAAAAAVRALRIADGSIERFVGDADADRDATGERHGPIARALRAMQFSLMDQLPALAWYEAALREDRTVLAIETPERAGALRVVEALRTSGGHFINRFGRLATEEFERWHGPEPLVSTLMKH